MVRITLSPACIIFRFYKNEHRPGPRASQPRILLGGDPQHPTHVAHTAIRRLLALGALLIPDKCELGQSALLTRVHVLDQVEQNGDRVSPANCVLPSAVDKRLDNES